jgi:hypothetical protein
MPEIKEVVKEVVTEVVAEVKQMLLDRGDRGGRSVKVEEDLVRVEDDWIYVIAVPTTANGSALALADLFQEIENDLEQRKHWSVLIVLASPEN